MSAVRFSKKTLVKVIAFTVVSAIFTVLLGLRIGNIQLFQHTYTLKAVFTNAQGVFKGDAVKLAGVDVGRVLGATIDRGRAIVEFRVDESVKLPEDTIVALRWRNVLGLRFLYLYPGTSGRYLQDGDILPESQTEPAGDIGEFLNHLGPILKAIDPSKANAFLDAVNTALAGNEASVRQLLSNGAVLSQRLADMDDEIRTLISSSDTVMAAYASQSENIERILDDLNVLGARLGTMTGDINSLITNFAVVQEELRRLLTENRSNIDASLRSLRSVITNLARNRVRLGTVLCTLPAGVAGYFQTTSWGEWFNVRIVQFVVKDREGRVVHTEHENDDQRAERDPHPVFYCPGQPPPTNPSNGSVDTVVPQPNAFQHVGTFVGFVTGAAAGG